MAKKLPNLGLASFVIPTIHAARVEELAVEYGILCKLDPQKGATVVTCWGTRPEIVQLIQSMQGPSQQEAG